MTFLYWLLVKSTQPDPPHVAKLRNTWQEIRAAAELTNLILPEANDETASPSPARSPRT